MSWRFIFAILVIALGASAWGGVRLGEWLVAHGPVKPEVQTTPPEFSDVPVLDADGRPFVAQAPQPLVDGRLGVPEPPEPIRWELAAPPVAQIQAETPISLATTTITMEEAIQIANANPHGLQGLADVGDLIGGGGNSGNRPVQIAQGSGGTQDPASGDWHSASSAAGEFSTSCRRQLGIGSSAGITGLQQNGVFRSTQLFVGGA